MPRRPKTAKRATLPTQPSAEALAAVERMAAMVETLLAEATSLPTREDRMYALSALAQMVSSPTHATKGHLVTERSLVTRIFEARYAEFKAAYRAAEDALTQEEIGVVAGVSKQVVQRIMAVGKAVESAEAR